MKRIIFLLSVLLFVGCASTPSAPPPPKERTSAIFNHSKNTIWPTLVSELSSVFPIKIIEKDSGLLSTDTVRLETGFNGTGYPNYIYTPRTFAPVWGDLRMNMQITVIEIDPTKTKVNIMTRYSAWESNVSKSWISAESNGKLENAILKKISNSLP